MPTEQDFKWEEFNGFENNFETLLKKAKALSIALVTTVVISMNSFGNYITKNYSTNIKKNFDSNIIFVQLYYLLFFTYYVSLVLKNRLDPEKHSNFIENLIFEIKEVYSSRLDNAIDKNLIREKFDSVFIDIGRRYPDKLFNDETNEESSKDYENTAFGYFIKDIKKLLEVDDNSLDNYIVFVFVELSKFLNFDALLKE